MQKIDTHKSSALEKIFHSTGEMGELILNKDWSETPLGPYENWPNTLRTTLSLILHSKFPMFLFWGNEFTCFYNDAYRPSLGINGKHPDILGMNAEQAWPEIWDIIEPLIHQVFYEGKPTWSEDQLLPIFRNGKIEDVHWTFSYSPVFDEFHMINGVLVTCVETTEKVKTIKLLELSNEQYLNSILQSPVAKCIFIGKNHVVTIINELMLNLLSRTSEQLLNKNIFEAIPELAQQGFESIMDNVYNTGQKFKAEELSVNIMRKDKMQTTYISIVLVPLREPDGTIKGINAIALDVTYHVKIRKEIEESEKQFRQLSNSLQELVWATDSEGKQTFASERWSEFTGLDPYGAETFEKITHPDDLPRVIEEWTNCLKSGKKYFIELRLKNKSGQYHWFQGKGEPIKDEDGNIIKWIGSFTDVQDQKKAEEFLINAYNKIDESEKRFRKIANEAPVFIWMAGSDKKCNFFNSAWLQFTGKTLEDEIGDGWINGVHIDDQKFCLDTYNYAFENREEFYMEYRLKRYDGEYRWISYKGTPRYSMEGIFEGYIGACVDINDRKIYETKLKEEDEKLNIIIDAGGLGTWELDWVTKVPKYSQKYLNILGYDEYKELTHEQLTNHLHPGDRAIREQAYKDAFKTGFLHYQTRITTNKNVLRWIEGKGKVFYDENKNPIKLIGTIRDITDEINYQQNLKERELKFRLLADAMPQFIWTADKKGNLNYFNKSLFEFSGLNNESLMEKGWLQIVHPEDQEESKNVWQKTIATGVDFVFEHRFKRSDGEYRWQLSRAIPQHDGNGNIQMWVGTSTDIHDLREQDQQKDYFIKMASHELKTPITSIKGYVQLLQSMYSADDDVFLKDSLNKLGNQINKMTNLIAELLDLSKIKSGYLSLQKQEFCMHQLVEEVINEINYVNPEHKIIFTKQNNAHVLADRIRIAQVLTNFLTNAIKYSPNSLEIYVNSDVLNDKILVSVEDRGIGISQADQKKIFERFYRVEGKNEKTFPGFGIGLFIAAEIIQRHNGEIGVKSATPKGSIFYFSLPIFQNH
ncbi:MAG: PAS domain S-box protein [Chitinophagales bacterium]|jgi:hypothetical protein|nr:PAS domain S-box protein [Chitinophagales bacterium]